MTDITALVQELQLVLSAALGGNDVERKLAEQKLKEAESSNFTLYLRALSAKLSDESSDISIRHISGICLKNAIKGNVGSSIDRSKRERYANLESTVRKELRDRCLTTLSASANQNVTKVVAQVVAAIARIELAVGQWPELIPSLTSLYDAKPEESLIAMSYLMEDIFLLQEEEMCVDNQRILQQADINLLLEPLVKGCEGPTEAIKIYALQGFYHALNLCEENMKVEGQQQAIMRAITSNLSTTQTTDVQQAAWDACVQLAMEYYSLLDKYIADMFPLSLSAINSDDENLAISAVEFWSTICDYEIYLFEENVRDQDLHLIQQARNFLIPVLIQKIAKEDEDEDDQWTLSMAVATCLTLCAQVLKDEILDVRSTSGNGSWVEEIIMNFNNENWSHREAALMAFGCILEGPSSQRLSPLIEHGLPTLIQGLNDQTTPVRETAAWTVGRIAQTNPQILLPLLRDGLIDLLLNHLSDDAKVSKYVCYAFYELAEYCIEENQNENLTAYSMIQPYFQQLCDALLRTATREDARLNSSLSSAAYEAMAKLLCATPTALATTPEFAHIILALVTNLLDMLEQSLHVDITDDVQRIQGHIAGCLSMACSRMDAINDAQLLNRLSNVLLQVTMQYRKFQTQAAARGDSIDEVQVSEDSLEAMDCLNVVLFNHTGSLNSPMLSDDVLKTLQNLIIDGMVPEQNPEYIKATVNLCRSFSSFLMARLPHQAAMEGVGTQIKQLFDLLRSPATNIEVKPIVIQVLGDLAMTCGNPWYMPYISDTLCYLEQAVIAVNSADAEPTPEWREYVELLHSSVLGAYSGVFYAVQSPMDVSISEVQIEKDLNERSTSVPFILEFLHTIFTDSKTSDEILLAALGLTGDLILAFKSQLITFMMQKASTNETHAARLNVFPIIEERTRNTTNERVREVADWIRNLYMKFKG